MTEGEAPGAAGGVAPDPLADLIAMTFREARARGVGIDDAAALIAQAIRGKLATTETEGLANADNITLQSVLGALSGTPLVQCKIGLEQWEWDVPTARQFVAALLQVIEGASMDATVMRWLTIGRLGMPPDVALQVIGELRRFRGDDQPRQDWRTPPADEPDE